jgi:hypothetical protein
VSPPGFEPGTSTISTGFQSQSVYQFRHGDKRKDPELQSLAQGLALVTVHYGGRMLCSFCWCQAGGMALQKGVPPRHLAMARFRS